MIQKKKSLMALLICLLSSFLLLTGAKNKKELPAVKVTADNAKARCVAFAKKRVCVRTCLRRKGRKCLRYARKRTCKKRCLRWVSNTKTKLAKPEVLKKAKVVQVLNKDPEIQKIVKGIQHFYGNLKSFQAKFEQVFLRKHFRQPMKEYGFFFYKRPAMMRFKYLRPEPKEVVYANKTVWMYDPEEEEVKIRKNIPKNQLGVAVQFLWGSGKLDQTFKISKKKPFAFGQPGDICLELIPRKPQILFKKLYFAVVPRVYRIRETVYIDPAGNRNRFIFSQMKVNTNIPTKAFRLKLPKGTTVIELK